MLVFLPHCTVAYAKHSFHVSRRLGSFMEVYSFRVFQTTCLDGDIMRVAKSDNYMFRACL